MTRDRAIAVIDIGKTNAKLTLVDAASRTVLAVRSTANTVVRDGPYSHFDVDMLWRWLLDRLAEFNAERTIGTISVTTHGACFTLLAEDRLALPVLDYEHDGPDLVRDDYDQLRGDFSETYSPALPNGLNAGSQLYWLSQAFPDDFARTTAILPYPQYWVWRLTGTMVAEATSLGCHTDLWAPLSGTYSHLAAEQGWAGLFPPLVRPWDTVGTVTAAVTEATGLAADCRVVAGIHDSNASLLPHLLIRKVPFSVLSTGTWAVAFAPGAQLEKLDPARDCLANVDAFGHPVPSARFMAGREFELIGGGAEPDDTDIRRVVSNEIMALPSFAPGTGPFSTAEGHWSTDLAALSAGERTAVASLYAALVAETCLQLTAADGPVVVEGPFAGNRRFCGALAQRLARPVLAMPDAAGTTEGAALLADGPEAEVNLVDPPAVPPLDIELAAYAEIWRQASDPPVRR